MYAYTHVQAHRHTNREFDDRADDGTAEANGDFTRVIMPASSVFANKEVGVDDAARAADGDIVDVSGCDAEATVSAGGFNSTVTTSECPERQAVINAVTPSRS